MATIQQLAERATDAFNAHDRAACEALCSDDTVLSAPGDMTATGRKEVCDFLQSWWDAFPDAHTTVRACHYAGDTYVEEGTFSGTQDGVFRTPMGDIPPTHRPVTGEYVSVNRCSGDHIVSEYLIFDRLQLLEQLGLVPSAATA
ncbi:MAG TPA: ester cyclase [Candidatus Dormibacteraeota bacterium]|nr:ester cyclase [Candidatus Dormibacteraeota bacterium]